MIFEDLFFICIPLFFLGFIVLFIIAANNDSKFRKSVKVASDKELIKLLNSEIKDYRRTEAIGNIGREKGNRLSEKEKTKKILRHSVGPAEKEVLSRGLRLHRNRRHLGSNMNPTLRKAPAGVLRLTDLLIKEAMKGKEKEFYFRILEKMNPQDVGTTFEKFGFLKEASELYKKKGLFDKMKKVDNSLKINLNQNVIHGDYIDDRDTIVKDSVINRSNVGGGSSKMQELEKLTEMKKEGLIDDDEFKQMKKEILGK